MHYVYVLKSKKSGKVYIGFTSDLRRRLKEHNERRSFATKFGAPYMLAYYEAYAAREDAKQREKHIKSYGQAYRRLKERCSFSLGAC